MKTSACFYIFFSTYGQQDSPVPTFLPVDIVQRFQNIANAIENQSTNYSILIQECMQTFARMSNTISFYLYSLSEVVFIEYFLLDMRRMISDLLGHVVSVQKIIVFNRLATELLKMASLLNVEMVENRAMVTVVDFDDNRVLNQNWSTIRGLLQNINFVYDIYEQQNVNTDTVMKMIHHYSIVQKPTFMTSCFIMKVVDSLPLVERTNVESLATPLKKLTLRHSTPLLTSIGKKTDITDYRDWLITIIRFCSQPEDYSLFSDDSDIFSILLIPRTMSNSKKYNVSSYTMLDSLGKRAFIAEVYSE